MSGVDFVHSRGDPLEMKVFLRVGPMDGSVYYALVRRGSPGDSLRS
jgi:hypothetical protein